MKVSKKSQFIIFDLQSHNLQFFQISQFGKHIARQTFNSIRRQISVKRKCNESIEFLFHKFNVFRDCNFKPLKTLLSFRLSIAQYKRIK